MLVISAHETLYMKLNIIDDLLYDQLTLFAFKYSNEGNNQQ